MTALLAEKQSFSLEHDYTVKRSFTDNDELE